MTPATPRRRLMLLAAALVTICSVTALVALPKLAPKVEQAKIGETPVEVSYQPVATAKDLRLPFYEGAAVADSFTYTLTSEQGTPVLTYASAILTTSDATAKVTAFYQEKLPGKPAPQIVKDDTGERIVFALAQEEEVQTITIAAVENGTRIELLRTTKLTAPPRTVRPRRQERAI